MLAYWQGMGRECSYSLHNELSLLADGSGKVNELMPQHVCNFLQTSMVRLRAFLDVWVEWALFAAETGEVVWRDWTLCT